MIYVPSFIQIATGVEGILRFCLNDLKGSDVGITDGKEFLMAPLRCAQVV
jgi:hypothetical protein